MTRRWLLGAMICCGCGRFDFQEPPSEEDQAPRLSYPASLHAVVSQTKLDVMPVTSGEELTFTVVPPLPAGLALEESSGRIHGVPTAMEDRGVHVVTVHNQHGSASAALQLSVMNGAVVDVFIDGFDDDDGQGNAICLSTTAGGCTLRAAFDTVNHLPGKQLVLLKTGTYLLTKSLAGLKNDLVIAGVGAGETTVQRADLAIEHRMAYVDVPRSLRLENLTVQGFSSDDGGALRVGKGALEVAGVVFENNVATLDSGGVVLVEEGGRADFDSTTFTGNRALSGKGWGGVINGKGLGTKITVKRSMATSNTAIWGSFSHLESGATLLLENSTLSGNTATRAGTLATPGGEYTLVNSTIAHNNVAFLDSAGIYLDAAPAVVSMANTIVAFNTDASGAQHNCNRAVVATVLKSLGGNLIGDGGGNCAEALSQGGDLMATDPLLDPKGLADNGGLTRTLALTKGSAAIDRGVRSLCPLEDQRGVARSGETCDAGAFEAP